MYPFKGVLLTGICRSFSSDEGQIIVFKLEIVFAVGHIIECIVYLEGITVYGVGELIVIGFLNTHTATASTVKLILCVLIVMPNSLQYSKILLAI